MNSGFKSGDFMAEEIAIIPAEEAQPEAKEEIKPPPRLSEAE